MILNKEEKTSIHLFEIPLGKQSFIGEVHEIRNEDEYNYHGYLDIVSYAYFSNLQIFLDKTWFSVDCSDTCIKSKIGKKLEKLNLKAGDILEFDALVEDKEIEFSYMDGEDDLNEDKILYYKPLAALPKNYKGIIIAEVYETEFNLYERLFKNNYIECFNRCALNKKN